MSPHEAIRKLWDLACRDSSTEISFDKLKRIAVEVIAETEYGHDEERWIKARLRLDSYCPISSMVQDYGVRYSNVEAVILQMIERGDLVREGNCVRLIKESDIRTTALEDMLRRGLP